MGWENKISNFLAKVSTWILGQLSDLTLACKSSCRLSWISFARWNRISTFNGFCFCSIIQGNCSAQVGESNFRGARCSILKSFDFFFCFHSSFWLGILFFCRGFSFLCESPFGWWEMVGGSEEKFEFCNGWSSTEANFAIYFYLFSRCYSSCDFFFFFWNFGSFLKFFSRIFLLFRIWLLMNSIRGSDFLLLEKQVEMTGISLFLC